MANEILIKVRVDDADVSPGLAATLAKVKAFGDGLSAEMAAAGREAGDHAGEQIADGLNRHLRELRLPEIDIHANAIEAQEKIKETELALRALAGDNPTIEVKVKTDKALSELKELRGHFKEVEDDGDKNGGNWATNFLKSASTKIGGASGLSSVLIPTGIALAPLLGASIAGAIVGGVGIGGIAGGLALAAQDSDVQLSMLKLRDDLSDHLSGAVEPFIKVAEQSIAAVDHALTGINFKGIFVNLAPQVAPLINGVTALITDLGGAIENISKTSGPVIAEIGHEFSALGKVLAGGLNSLTDNADGEAQALKDLFSIINGSIEVVFKLINALTEVYGVFHKLFDLGVPGLYEMIADKQFAVKDSAVEMAQSMIESSKATDQSTISTDLATAALKAQDDAIHQVADSLKASTDPLFAFMDAEDNLTEKQTALNKAIKVHGANSKEARAATKDYQKALIDYVSSAANATNGTGHLTAQQKQLLSSAGTSKKRINELDTALYNAWKQANKLDGFEVDITVKQRFIQTGKYISNSQIANPTQLYSGLAHGGIKGAASGATSSGLTWTGEHGPELLDLPPGTAVHTAGDSKRMAAEQGGGPAGTMVIQLVLDGRVLTERTVDHQRRFVRDNFGGSVQAAYGYGVPA
jgi:hypothetical protein